MAVPLLGSAAMRALDRLTIEEIGIPGPVLMEVAGRACAAALEEFLPAGRPGRVAVVCGKGNNGGDGFVAARHLHHAGHRVEVILLADPNQLRGEAALNFGILERIHVPVRTVTDMKVARKLAFHDNDAILDALLGTGLANEVRGPAAAAIAAINNARIPVVSVDIPSGVSADTGQILGVSVRADRTVTFGCPKPGHVQYPGAALTGDLRVADIGLPPDRVPQGPGSSWLLTDEDAAAHLRRREADAHKGRFGHLVVVAGSTDKPGAAGLCCRAALRTGVGLVTLAAPDSVLGRVVVGPVEYMGAVVESPKQLKRLCVDNKQGMAIGPGLGRSSNAAELVRIAVAEIALPLVVDADGLNNLVGHLDLLKRAPAARILTPHPGEMARLLETTTVEVQRDRLACARRLACDYGCIVVLKGAGTVVADPDQRVRVIQTGNPGMASAGTGDVLTGVIAALLCQGLEAADAAAIGAHLHGLAGDEAETIQGQHGLVASDILECLPLVLKRFESWDTLKQPPVRPKNKPGAIG